MKKVLLHTAAVLLLGAGTVAADASQPLVTSAAETSKNNNLGLVSIDSVYIMQNSKEGQKLNTELEKKVNDLQEFVNKSQKELVKLQEDIKAKSELLSKDALQEQADALVEKKKRIESEINTKQERLRAETQRTMLKLRDKQLALTQKAFKDNKWGNALIDKNTPGLLCVADSIDRTEELLKIIDKDYENGAKKTLTASADKSKVTEKKEIKTA